MVLLGNEVQYENGYKLGQIDPEDAKKVYIHNHLSIHLKYNKVEDDETGQSLYRIVGFTVIPHSIDQSAYQIDDGSCSITNFDKHQEITKDTDAIVFSYSGRKKFQMYLWTKVVKMTQNQSFYLENGFCL